MNAIVLETTQLRTVGQIEHRLLDPGDETRAQIGRAPHRVQGRRRSAHECHYPGFVQQLDLRPLLGGGHDAHTDSSGDGPVHPRSRYAHEDDPLGAVVAGGDAEPCGLDGRSPGAAVLRTRDDDVVARRHAPQTSAFHQTPQLRARMGIDLGRVTGSNDPVRDACQSRRKPGCL